VTGTARRWSPGWWCTAFTLLLAGAWPERISVRHRPSGKPLDALIIGGGDDIGPEHYNGDITAAVKADPERDRLEIEWIRRALSQNTPLMGICRGAQLINVVLGGSLHQDIRNLRKLTYNRPGLMPTKTVRLVEDSQIAQVCGKKTLRVNSLHHQAVKEVGKGMRIVGRDLDDIVQAIEAPRGVRIVGVQWHPEYLFYLPAQFAIFRWLVKRSQ
jgi:putative glutamine amidotransferase